VGRIFKSRGGERLTTAEMYSRKRRFAIAVTQEVTNDALRCHSQTIAFAQKTSAMSSNPRKPRRAVWDGDRRGLVVAYADWLERYAREHPGVPVFYRPPRLQGVCRRCGGPARAPGTRGPVPVTCARCAHRPKEKP